MDLLAIPVDDPPCAQSTATSRRKVDTQRSVIRHDNASSGSCKLTMQGAAVGVRVRGREVVKVLPGSQAERAGVRLGWKVTRIAEEEVPAGGQAAADAITEALACA